MRREGARRVTFPLQQPSTLSYFRLDSQEDQTSLPQRFLHLLSLLFHRLHCLTPLLFVRTYTHDFNHNRPAFWSHLFADALAGLTVGAMVVPQAMSFATVAGLQPVYGLYNALMGLIPYPIFGTSPVLVPGPTSVMSLLVKHSLPSFEEDDIVGGQLIQLLAFCLAFFVGMFQVCGGLLGLGWMLHLVSEPVISGFTIASAFLIASTQFATLVGVPKCARSDGYACTLIDATQNVRNWADVVEIATPMCSILSLVFLVLVKTLSKRLPRAKWIGSLGPLLLMLITVPLAYHLDYKGGWGKTSNTCVATNFPPCEAGVEEVAGRCCVDRNPFREAEHGTYDYNENVRVYDQTWHLRQIGPIFSGLPDPLFPFGACTATINQKNLKTISLFALRQGGFKNVTCVKERVSVSDIDYEIPSANASLCTFMAHGEPKLLNMTITEQTVTLDSDCTKGGYLSDLLQPALLLSFMGYLEGMTIAKAVARTNGGTDARIHPSNELFAVGMSNLACSMFQGFPVAGSFSRTMVNANAGATSSLSLWFCALVVVICLQFLTPVLAYMPKFTFSAIILDAIIKLVDPRKAVYLWHTDRHELVVYLVTFITCTLYQVDVGILFGILLAWAFALTYHAPPTVSIRRLQRSNSVPPRLQKRASVYTASHKPTMLTRPLSHDQSTVVDIPVRGNITFATGYRLQEAVQDALTTSQVAVVLLDISTVTTIDSTGLQVLESVTAVAVEQGVSWVLLASPTAQVYQKIRQAAKRTVRFSDLWETAEVHKSARPSFHNSGARLAIFDSVNTALEFIDAWRESEEQREDAEVAELDTQ